MAASSTATTTIICCLEPPAPPKQSAAGARRPHVPVVGVSVSSSASASHALRRAYVVAAACAVVRMVGGVGDVALALARDGAVAASRTDAVVVGAAAARAKAPPPRWSDRRQCPPWRANSLENIVPENLPRPSAPRRFDGVSASAAEGEDAAPDLVAPPSSFLALRPATAGCF